MHPVAEGGLRHSKTPGRREEGVRWGITDVVEASVSLVT